MTIYRKQRKEAPRGRSVYGAAPSAVPAPAPEPAASALTADDMLDAYAADQYDAYAADPYGGQYAPGENGAFAGGVIMPEDPAYDDAALAGYGASASVAPAALEEPAPAPVEMPGVTDFAAPAAPADLAAYDGSSAGSDAAPSALPAFGEVPGVSDFRASEASAVAEPAPTDFLGAVEEASRALGAEPPVSAEASIELTDVTVESTDGVPLGADAGEVAPAPAAGAADAVPSGAVEPVTAEADAEDSSVPAADEGVAAPAAPELTDDTPVGTTPALFSPEPAPADELARAGEKDAPKKKPARRTRSRRSKKDAEPAPHRTASVQRATGETDIRIELDLDGSGTAQISTGVPFFDHMLDAFCRHGLFDLTVEATGDVEVDAHHTVEDTGIVLGQAFAEALGDKRGVTRFADVAVPLDEALVQAVVDLSGRGQAYCTLPLPTERVGAFDTELAVEFFYAFARDARATLHVRELAGANSHHIIEAAFKAAGRAMRRACELDPRVTGIPSTKGSL